MADYFDPRRVSTQIEGDAGAIRSALDEFETRVKSMTKAVTGLNRMLASSGFTSATTDAYLAALREVRGRLERARTASFRAHSALVRYADQFARLKAEQDELVTEYTRIEMSRGVAAALVGDLSAVPDDERASVQRKVRRHQEIRDQLFPRVITDYIAMRETAADALDKALEDELLRDNELEADFARMEDTAAFWEGIEHYAGAYSTISGAIAAGIPLPPHLNPAAWGAGVAGAYATIATTNLATMGARTPAQAWVALGAFAISVAPIPTPNVTRGMAPNKVGGIDAADIINGMISSQIGVGTGAVTSVIQSQFKNPTPRPPTRVAPSTALNGPGTISITMSWPNAVRPPQPVKVTQVTISPPFRPTLSGATMKPPRP